MRNRLLGPSVALLAFWVASSCVQIGSERASNAAPAYRAPRTGDGKPNLSGIWQSMNEANWNIEAHSADFPRMLDDGRGGRDASGSRHC